MRPFFSMLWLLWVRCKSHWCSNLGEVYTVVAFLDMKLEINKFQPLGL